ncbi:MAG TPA: trypsin-like peptidase domain-containing protein [Acidimicrobiales bacterium]|nr:trypsin-like peptidase domain-containing protein [Acidimicrobiales bacterium]
MTTTDEQQTTVQRVAERAAPAVVRIGRHGGRGCGVVVGDGLVLTNAHNLRDRTTQVTFADGRAVQGRATGVDPDDDLVVLAVDTGDAPALPWADDTAGLGATVFAVAALADGHRVTVGTVSAVDRSFRGPRGRLVTGGIEHTAPLARGSSGGPIVDAEGRLVGVTTLRLGDGFSIAQPAGAALRQRVDALATGDAPRRRLLGIGAAPPHVARRMRRAVGLPDRAGVLVRAVEPDSPAARAGLREGDLVTAAGGAEIADTDALTAALDAVPDGGTLALHVVRGVDEVDVVVRFEPAPADAGGPADVGDA